MLKMRWRSKWCGGGGRGFAWGSGGERLGLDEMIWLLKDIINYCCCYSINLLQQFCGLISTKFNFKKLFQEKIVLLKWMVQCMSKRRTTKIFTRDFSFHIASSTLISILESHTCMLRLEVAEEIITLRKNADIIFIFLAANTRTTVVLLGQDLLK